MNRGYFGWLCNICNVRDFSFELLPEAEVEYIQHKVDHHGFRPRPGWQGIAAQPHEMPPTAALRYLRLMERLRACFVTPASDEDAPSHRPPGSAQS